MAAGDHAKPSPANNPPSKTATAAATASSSSQHRKSRWSSSNNNNSGGGNVSNSNPTAGHKAGDKRPSKPNPSPKPGPNPSQPYLKHPNPTDPPPPRSLTGPIPPTAPFPFPDPAALGPPPPPSYGFHMLERRSIVLADGSVRSYFALPPDYQDFPPPPRPVDPTANRFLGHEFGRFPHPISPEGFRDKREHWDRPDGSMKRKFPGEEEKDRRYDRGELMRQRQQQFMQYANANGQSLVDGTNSVFVRDFREDTRAAKHMRIGAGGYDNGGQVIKHLEVDQAALKKAFLHFIKVIYENTTQRKNYLENGKKGRLQCLVCGRSSKDFQDTHGLVMHMYSSDNANSRVDHLGLHRALCVLMGWNFSKVPDNSKAYQILPAEAAAANQADLIIWPPHVIVHNTSTGKGKEGRIEGYGNKVMDNRIRELGFTGGKSKSLYGREGHLGITLFRYSGDESGLRDAMRLSEYFEKNNRGRRSWARVQPLATTGKDDEKNPSLVEVDERTGERKRVLYGYLGTVSDLDKVDFDTKKKITIESLRECGASR